MGDMQAAAKDDFQLEEEEEEEDAMEDLNDDEHRPRAISLVSYSRRRRSRKASKTSLGSASGREMQAAANAATAVGYIGRLHGRRPSLVNALEGHDDNFETRQNVMQQVVKIVERLGSGPTQRKSQTGFCMSTLLLVLLLILFFALEGDPLVAVGESGWNQPPELDSDGFEVSGGYTQRFELNEPVAVFVDVSALIYALIFASAYTEAQQRLDEIRRALVQEAAGVHMAMLLVRTLDADDTVYKARTLLLFGHYIQLLSDEISEKPGKKSDIEALYAAVPSLSCIAADGDGDEMDRVIIERTIDTLNKVCEARSIRETALHNEQTWITFGFLCEMCTITVFGVLHLQFGASTFCATICRFILQNADLQRPFKGFVTVDISIFDRIRHSISQVLAEVDLQENKTIWVGAIPLELVEPDEAIRNIKAIFGTFGKVEKVSVRRKSEPPSWAPKDKIGSWALITFEDVVHHTAAEAMQLALEWDGWVQYGSKSTKVQLIVKKSNHDTKRLKSSLEAQRTIADHIGSDSDRCTTEVQALSSNSEHFHKHGYGAMIDTDKHLVAAQHTASTLRRHPETPEAAGSAASRGSDGP